MLFEITKLRRAGAADGRGRGVRFLPCRGINHGDSARLRFLSVLAVGSWFHPSGTNGYDPWKAWVGGPISRQC